MKRLLIIACQAALVSVAGATGVTLLSRGTGLPPRSGQLGPSTPPSNGLKVMTLNIAHGRADGRHQALQRAADIETNLDRIGDLVLRSQADIVALQEVDGPSRLSAPIEAAEHIARRGKQAHFVRGRHTVGFGLDYGTAVLTKLPVQTVESQTFAPTPPTFTKGFTRATVADPRSPTGAIDVISVHLDFARGSARSKQIDALVEALEARPHPRIIMGDFNAQWPDAPVQTLVERLALKTWAPDTKLSTFDTFGTRIDWIFVSADTFDFVTHQVLEAGLSDHRPVVAELAWRHSAPSL